MAVVNGIRAIMHKLPEGISKVLSEMTLKTVHVAFDEDIREVDVLLLPQAVFREEDREAACVYSQMKFFSPHEAQVLGMLLIFIPLEEAKFLLDAIRECFLPGYLSEDVSRADIACELGNIIFGHIVSELANHLELSIIHTVPEVEVNTAAAVAGTLAALLAERYEKAYLLDMHFKVEDTADVSLVVLPEQEVGVTS